MPRSSVRSAAIVEHPVEHISGWKLPGSRLPGVFAIGTFIDGGRRTFAVVHHGTQLGVRISLEGAVFDELLIGCDDPEAVVSMLERTP